MYKGQKSVRNGIQDFLCPFEAMYISQGSNGKYSHRGIMANDVRGLAAGVRYNYYAPCDVKCVKTYPQSGQAMWQSLEKVRFANGRIDYITFMTCHDDTFNAVAGKTVVRQGEQLGTMGTRGNATGVHCHIQTAQTKDTAWYANRYNIYQFNNEYDLDDCYFVDNTKILHGMGGNWRTTNQVPVKEISGGSVSVADQLIYKGSKVKFDGIFKVDILKSPIKTNLFGCCELTGVPLIDYKNERAKAYHWIPLDDFTEVDKNGSSLGQDQRITGGSSYVLNKNVYEVKEIDKKTNSAKLNISGRDVWVFSAFLYEVQDSPIER